MSDEIKDFDENKIDDMDLINMMDESEEMTEMTEVVDETAAVEIFVQDTEGEGFLADLDITESTPALAATDDVELLGTELESFETADIEEVEFVEDERLESIVESILFASDRPVSLNSIKMVFEGTNIKTDRIRKALDKLAIEYAGVRRGVTLEEVPGGYQLRTKIDNMDFLKRTLKARPFKLSGPALEVLAIIAYKQPLIKAEVDEIRGVESGHLLRALMEKGLVNFEGKSDLPGKPMQYGTTKKFLEIFGLRNLKELPTLSQIDELLPEGIGEEETKEKQKLSDLTDKLSEQIGSSYSEGEEELNKITDQLQSITTSSDFFEQEKQRQRDKRDAEKAQNIRDALTFGEEVSNRDINWLKRYDEAMSAGVQFQEAPIAQVENTEVAGIEAAQFDGATNLNPEAEEILEGEFNAEEEEMEDDFAAADPSYDDDEASR